MSYQYRILKDYPIQAYPLNAAETAPTDISGYAAPASLTTAPALGPPLVMGGGNSIVINSANKLQFASSAFNGDVTKSFSLEVWLKPITTGRILVLGHSGGRDGIQYDGETISFGTSHGAAGSSVAIYYVPEVSDGFHVVGVHSPNKNQLFVNNVLVAEADVTDAHVLAGYDNTDNILYSGTSYTGSPSILLDAVAVYAQPLTSNQIRNHFIAGRDTEDYRDVVSAHGGSFWDFTDMSTLIGFQKTFNTDYDWRAGQLGGVNVQGGVLYPSFDPNGVTNTGYWTFSQIFSVSNPLGGSKIEWDGDGTFIVQSSLDNGVSWTPCVNGREIPTLTEGFDTTHQSLLVRILFAAGEPIDTITKVRWLTIKLYNDRNLSQFVAGRTVDIVGNAALSSDIHQPIELHDDWGVDLYNGYGIVSPDTSQVPQPVRVVEMWVKIPPMTAASKYFIDFRGSGGGTGYWGWNGTAFISGSITFIINGVQYTAATMPATNGQWMHVVMILGADHLGSFILGAANTLASISGMQIGMLATYPVTMTVAQATALYNSYIGATTSRVDDTSIVNITEPANGIKLYQYDWSMAGV